ncbi:MAG: hypothetical protein JRG91_03965 [Deltaproteobacteria bacterium]|nr:hypothetical protein [Deltaproteobacteria bacterium]
MEIGRNGEPRLARQAASQLHRYRESFQGAYGVFVAPYISPKAAEICKGEEIGYVDLCGNCRLSFDDVDIEREGRPNQRGKKRDLRTLYSPRATRVLRVLLAGPGKVWKVTALAKAANVSPGLASNVKKLLANREWIGGDRNGITLERPHELLDEWSSNYSFRRNEPRDFYSLQTPAQIEQGLAEACDAMGVRYALTGFSAASRIAPMVTFQRAFAYVEGHLDEVSARLGLKEVDSGPVVTLLLPYDEGVFHGVQDVEGIQTVSALQAYLDLQGFRGRGEEAARAILEEVLAPTW